MIETRDARGIARMLAMAVRPRCPRRNAALARPEMLLAAFSVGMRRKSHRAASPARAAGRRGPAIAAVRTTNDRRIARNRAPSPKAGAEGRAWLRADIERARAVPGLVPDGLLRYLELGRWAGPSRRELLLRRPPPPRSRAFRTLPRWPRSHACRSRSRTSEPGSRRTATVWRRSSRRGTRAEDAADQARLSSATPPSLRCTSASSSAS